MDNTIKSNGSRNLYKMSEKPAYKLHKAIIAICNEISMPIADAAKDIGVSTTVVRNLERGICTEKHTHLLTRWIRKYLASKKERVN